MNQADSSSVTVASKGPGETIPKPGDIVIWHHNYWTVRCVNYNANLQPYSLALDRPGVTTCVEPHEVQPA